MPLFNFFFLFPFLRTLLKLGMQLAGSFYFGLTGLLLGTAAGFLMPSLPGGTFFSWQMCAVSGGLAGTCLGSFLAPAYFKPRGAQSDVWVWVRSASASATIAFFSLPAAGAVAVFLSKVRAEDPIMPSLASAFKQSLSNFHLMEDPRGWVIGGLVFVSGMGFRALLDALDGPEGDRPRQV